MSKLLPCPFCGNTPDVDEPETFQTPVTCKWGCVTCCCYGPDVRTGYGPLKDWKADAIKAWNKRAALKEEE